MATRTSKSGHQGLPEGAQRCALFRFDIDPVPASRPRVTRYGTYHTKTYKAWLEGAAGCLKAYSAQIEPGHLAVNVEVVCRKPRTSKLTTPKGDIDNYAKAALDAITHARLWEDDKWITTLVATKRFAEPGEEPHTSVEAFRCA